MGIGDVPAVVWPEEGGIYKMVQVRSGESQYMRFGSERFKHFDVLRKLLLELGIDDFPALDGRSCMPAPESHNYRLVGAGMAHIKLPPKTIMLLGMSEYYQMGHDMAAFEEIMHGYPDWTIKRVDG